VLPWGRQLSRRVKARLRLREGTRRETDLEKVGEHPGKDWMLESYTPEKAEAARWVRLVYASDAGVPVGTRDPEHKKALWIAFEHIGPLQWARLARLVPKAMVRKLASCGVRLKVTDAAGNEHLVSTGPQWTLSGMLQAGLRGRRILSRMLAAALSLAGRHYGYGGLTLVHELWLEITSFSEPAIEGMREDEAELQEMMASGGEFHMYEEPEEEP
jgi:hypothetical protein